MTRADLRTRVYEALADSAASPVTYATTEVDAWLDEGAEVLAEEARLVRRTVYLPVRAAHTFYTTRGLTPAVMAIWRVWHPSRTERLDPVAMGELDRHHETWRATTGDPQAWFAVAFDTFGVYPVPASDGQLLRVDVLAWPTTPVADDARYADLPDQTAAALVSYGVYLGLMGRHDTRRALDWYSRFLGEAGLAGRTAAVGRGGLAFQRAEAR